MNWFKEFPREQFLSLVSSGSTEMEALQIINDERKLKFAHTVPVQMQVKLPAFREALEDAKKLRADVWFNGIVKSVADTTLDKEDVPVEKLKFEQRKYLAAIDNPEKYSEKIKHQMDVSVNIFQEMKDLSHSQVKSIMSKSDPFAVEAEFESLEDEEMEVEAVEVESDEKELSEMLK